MPRIDIALADMVANYRFIVIFQRGNARNKANCTHRSEQHQLFVHKVPQRASAEAPISP